MQRKSRLDAPGALHSTENAHMLHVHCSPTARYPDEDCGKQAIILDWRDQPHYLVNLLIKKCDKIGDILNS